MDYRAVFRTQAKWVTEIDQVDRIPEIISRAFHVATSGRPGPVVIALPEDMLVEYAEVADAPHYEVLESAATAQQMDALAAQLANARKPIARSEEHTSELQSLMRISYAVFCLKKKKYQKKCRRERLRNTRESDK